MPLTRPPHHAHADHPRVGARQVKMDRVATAPWSIAVACEQYRGVAVPRLAARRDACVRLSLSSLLPGRDVVGSA